jgi:hypothetical protein
MLAWDSEMIHVHGMETRWHIRYRCRFESFGWRCMACVSISILSSSFLTLRYLSTDSVMVRLLRNIHTEGNATVESVDGARTLNNFWIMDANFASSEQVMLAPCTGLSIL